MRPRINSGDSDKPAASRKHRGETEIRLDEKELDEVCAWGSVHLERMDTGAWTLIIDTVDGKRLMVNLYTKNRSRAAVHGRAEVDGRSELATPLLAAVRIAIGRDRRRINRNRRRDGWRTLREDGL